MDDETNSSNNKKRSRIVSIARRIYKVLSTCFIECCINTFPPHARKWCVYFTYNNYCKRISRYRFLY